VTEQRNWERARVLLPALIEVAKSGREPMTYGDVGRMFNTGPRNIDGGLLNKIDALCEQQGLPHLRTLVVLAADGLPSGDWSGFATAEEKRAAQADCYRHFGASVPESVSRLRRRSNGAPGEVVRPACATCFMELPVTGICDNCS
jgi:hypothetical protein